MENVCDFQLTDDQLAEIDGGSMKEVAFAGAVALCIAGAGAAAPFVAGALLIGSIGCSIGSILS